ncbi:hypothetical protein PHYPSEUDO_004306 [Phytophthora pseudosyringae]|uniref:Uncharacterized protein n=1 Tax=Phytophthora pseudosyringae TaxID=221518 RepID=A0A8T1VNC4_9STRA|nr:hypothetical protein PHYPSEUDO_004306 [Phytophthora pseudosyringae]
MSLKGKIVVITGASMGIGAATARRFAHEGGGEYGVARSIQRQAEQVEELHDVPGCGRVLYFSVDVRDSSGHDGHRDPAWRALDRRHLDDGRDERERRLVRGSRGSQPGRHGGAGARCDCQRDVRDGFGGAGEAVYHMAKVAQEGFSNSLRNELCGTNIKVVVVRPGVVATNFHEQRVGFDQQMYSQFMEGYEPLVSDDVADAIVWVLGRPERVMAKALDVVPTAQRSLSVFDRE